MPRFAVVVPAFNAEATLRETLDAVAAQEFGDWECVVTDDGSTDSTASIVRAYTERDARFKLVQQENQGAAAAHNAAVRESSAEFLVVCAADDFLLPNHMAAMDELIRSNPDCDIYSSNGEFLYDKTGDRRPVYTSREWQRERSLSFEQVLEQCFYGVGAVYRRSLLDISQGYRSGTYSDDWDFWLRSLAKGARHRYTPQILSVHRVSDFQQTANLEKVYESNVAVLRNLIDGGWVRPEQARLVESAIEAQRETLLAAPVLEQQAEQLRRSVEKVVGKRLAGPTMRGIHSVSWMVRPFRQARASRRRD